jgi:hypothetical protein
MFLVMPAMLRSGIGFWPGLGVAVAMTIVLYVMATLLLSKAGIKL